MSNFCRLPLPKVGDCNKIPSSRPFQQVRSPLLLSLRSSLDDTSTKVPAIIWVLRTPSLSNKSLDMGGSAYLQGLAL